MPTEKSEVVYSIEAEKDDLEAMEAFLCDAYNQEEISEIAAKSKKGNIWIWAAVRVTASFQEFQGEDCLCGCNYASKKDFIQSETYQDMKNRALENLLDKLRVASEAYLQLTENNGK